MQDIRMVREAAGIKASAVAERVGISKPVLSDYEHGKRSFDPVMEARIIAAIGQLRAEADAQWQACLASLAELRRQPVPAEAD